MARKILITLQGDVVAPRFDLCTEALIAAVGGGASEGATESLVLPRESAEDLCQLILRERIDTVVCGGIEEEFFQFLSWKKIEVVDSVVGRWDRALELAAGGKLEPGSILREDGAAERL